MQCQVCSCAGIFHIRRGISLGVRTCLNSFLWTVAVPSSLARTVSLPSPPNDDHIVESQRL
jgi:hypothetical protein